MEKNKPARVLWDGNIKAAIFANQGQNGPIYNTAYARIYTDKQGSVKEAYSFSGSENLRIAELARQAYQICNALRQEFNSRNLEPSPQSAAHDQMSDQYNIAQS